MRGRRARPSRIPRGPSHEHRLLADAALSLRAPVEMMLTHAIRRLAHRRPNLFARLGAYQTATFRLAPTDLPIAFDLTPGSSGGTVLIVNRAAPGVHVARMAAPLADLLALFDGSLDADAAFFHRTLQVEGDIAAVMALHNTLEAADLRLADLFPLPIGGDLINNLLENLLRHARRHGAPAGA